MNDDFLSRDWGDSLPLYPATRQQSMRYCKAPACRRLIWCAIMPPGFGLATVEKMRH